MAKREVSVELLGELPRPTPGSFKRKRSSSSSLTVTRSDLLRLVLPASGPDEEDRYAFTRCPETYEDAVKAAVDTLGPYMVNATTDNVVLRVSHEVKGKKHIWAEIRRQDWDVICQEQREIGVFRKARAGYRYSEAEATPTSSKQENTMPATIEFCAAQAVLFILEQASQRRIALIPIAGTYEDAQKAALEHFKRFIPSATAQNLLLQPSVTGNLEDCAEIKPENWRVLSPLYRAVGVFLDVDSTFANGKVWLVCATFSRHGILWAPISAQKDGAGKYGTTLTSRPNSYQAAVLAVEASIDEDVTRKKRLLADFNHLSVERDINDWVGKPFRVPERRQRNWSSTRSLVPRRKGFLGEISATLAETTK